MLIFKRNNTILKVWPLDGALHHPHPNTSWSDIRWKSRIHPQRSYKRLKSVLKSTEAVLESRVDELTFYTESFKCCPSEHMFQTQHTESSWRCSTILTLVCSVRKTVPDITIISRLRLSCLDTKRKQAGMETQRSLKSNCDWQTPAFSERVSFVNFINLQEETVWSTSSMLASTFKDRITYPKIIFMSLSVSCHNQLLQGFPHHTPTVKSKQSLVIWLLPVVVPCIYNCANILPLCLISWRTQHATHIAAGSSPV